MRAGVVDEHIFHIPGPQSQLQGVFIGKVSCGLPGKRGEELPYLLPDVCWTISGGESLVEVG